MTYINAFARNTKQVLTNIFGDDAQKITPADSFRILRIFLAVGATCLDIVRLSPRGLLPLVGMHMGTSMCEYLVPPLPEQMPRRQNQDTDRK